MQTKVSGRRTAALAALTAALLVVIPTATAAADPPLKTQAIGIMNASYGEFMALKSSPSRNNRFDWASDGCSGPHTSPVDWLRPFYLMHDAPCQLHDFGYRNFGNGLRLERTESRREWIDGRFLSEMLRNCSDHWWYVGCETSARGFWGVVRLASDWGS